GSAAFKLALHDRGARCNRYEAELYRQTTPARRAMLCPVIWCSENAAVLVARRAIPLTQLEFDKIWSDESEDMFPDWDYRPGQERFGETPFEYKPSDWGWLDRRLVAVD